MIPEKLYGVEFGEVSLGDAFVFANKHAESDYDFRKIIEQLLIRSNRGGMTLQEFEKRIKR